MVTLRRILTLPVGGLHVKHAVQRGILDTNSAFALGPRKTTENLLTTHIVNLLYISLTRTAHKKSLQVYCWKQCLPSCLLAIEVYHLENNSIVLLTHAVA
jgi:hypothetical protein